MTVIDYFTKPCEACEQVEGGENPPIGSIKNRFVLNEYNTAEEGEKGTVETKRKRVGEIPAIRMNVVDFEDGERKHKVRWIAGVTPFEKLAEDCDEWERKKGSRRKIKDPVVQNMDVRDSSYGKRRLKWR